MRKEGVGEFESLGCLLENPAVYEAGGGGLGGAGVNDAGGKVLRLDNAAIQEEIR